MSKHKKPHPGYVIGTGLKRQCEECGRDFLIPELDIWCYKAQLRFAGDQRPRMRYFCSWSCRCAAERRKIPTRAERRIAHELQARTIFEKDEDE